MDLTLPLNAAFGELRSMMQHAPSAALWDKICTWLEDHDSVDGSGADPVRYLLGHLDKWPYKLRQAPRRWTSARSRSHARWCQIARVFDLSQMGLAAGRLGALEGLDPAGVWGLDLSKNWFEQEALEDFAQAAHWQQLRWLDLSFNRMQNPGVQALWTAAKAGGLPKLQELNLERTALEEGSLVRLGATPLAATLESLWLGQNWLRSRDLADLRMHVRFRRLRHLHLDRNRFGSPAVRNLLTMPADRFEHLEVLTLAQNELDDRACRAVAWSQETPALSCLELSSNHVGDQGMRYLAESSLHPGLRTLGLAQNDLSDDALWAIKESPYFQGLRRLGLSRNGFTLEGVRTLTRGGDRLDNLRELDLSGHRALGAGALGALWGWPRFANLSSLNLSACDITLPQAFVSGEPCGLEQLDLSFNPIADHGLANMLAPGRLRRLRRLRLTQCDLGPRVMDILLENSSQLEHLEVLELQQNDIASATVGILRRNLGKLPALRQVGLDLQKGPEVCPLNAALAARG